MNQSVYTLVVELLAGIAGNLEEVERLEAQALGDPVILERLRNARMMLDCARGLVRSLAEQD